MKRTVPDADGWGRTKPLGIEISFHEVMTGPTARTWRAHRTAIERLKGYDRVYETEISEGLRSVRGRGPTRETSIAEAQRRWLQHEEDADGSAGVVGENT